MNETTINKTNIKNGPVILSEYMPGVRSATLAFLFRCGSRHEPVELGGITHLIEHCVFKGTGRRSAMEIAVATDRLGGSFDAFTTHEETGFAIKVIDDRVEEAFDLVAELLSDPLFADADLKSEKRVIIEEIKMSADSPDERLGDLFTERFFAGDPLGRPIAGTPKTVRSFTRPEVKKYFDDRFHPQNLIIAAAGNIEHDRLASLAEKHFAGRKDTPAKLSTSEPRTTPSIVIKNDANLEQSHFIIAFPFVNASDPRRYAADLLSSVVGGGTSSRLWQRIREKHGLAYSVGAHTAMYADCGFFSMFAATSPKNFIRAAEIAIGELADIVADGVNEMELDLAKRQAEAAILLGLEDSAARASSLAQCEMLYGRPILLEETLENINAVTADDLKELAREYFRAESATLAALGSLKGIKFSRERFAVLDQAA